MFGLAHVLIKDESQRFGLPAFNILGAAANAHGVRLVACTDGNWGRAVARIAKYLGVPAKIFVPCNIDASTQRNIQSEGADVPVVQGDYDDSIRAVMQEAEKSGALLVMDTSWPGYEEIPGWVVEGYTTMISETDSQTLPLTANKPATHAIAPVGVGSWAQSVTAHCKSKAAGDGHGAVIAVEPTTAASLKTSLEAGAITPIRTGDTIMCGMNCGTVSTLAWPTLRDGVDASIVVDDAECHAAAPLGLGPQSVVVLFCTEGARPYDVPA
ncbi:uncharacterized protein K452DRAFT_293606 [Aplosporella prunicola CBS 121167]|uniref:Tryptophan synthase beta chain-like PALP domain-containing protein n=1 Tax=Aplosporella prunicola CBS 121167 TaxID=1176127 RepID=A0A6A6BV50_9PEZI|nr:uncharacterized protein K452DRAFT_293606 [Aplosporella prunicola CBS 121167]KAF2147135.1 hypothetical protein K452DRAFT_293606 [Aplosporella prunicola CBS 121167]